VSSNTLRTKHLDRQLVLASRGLSTHSIPSVWWPEAAGVAYIIRFYG